jgi:ADP-L-glycero-D-manno-heptose 6-epimerase
MIVVTGGAGFIGSAMVWHLNKLGITDIIVVDNLYDSEKWRNLTGIQYADYFHRDQFISDILEGAHYTAEITAIIHMGACSATTETDGDFLMENNYRYTKILAEWAIHNTARFIYASSAATYGEGENGFEDNIDTIETLRPINRYGYSKQLFDCVAKKNGWLDKIVGLKFFNVYGPNESHKENMRSVVNKAFAQVKEAGQIKLFRSYKDEYPNGGQMRDFIYVKDIVKVMAWLLDNPNVNGIYNVGTSNARTWNDLARALFKAMQVEENIEYIDMPENLINQYQYYTQADMGRLIEQGYTDPMMSLEEGVFDYVVNYLEPSRLLDSVHG